MNEQDKNLLVEFSDSLADAAQAAAAWTVMVDARRRRPASGILYAPELILTANHVVEREEEIGVVYEDGSQVRAVLAGRDPGTDLALLRLERPAGGPEAVPAPAEARVGQIVLAIGRPDGEGIQASLGVISAIGGPVRTGRGGLLERYLATDAIPYPGFSGGPLVDAAGQLVGLNTSGLTRRSSLAIPARFAWQVAGSLAEHGQVRRGYLGIRSQPVALPETGRQSLGRAQETGLLVVSVETDSPAEAGGVMVGDILVGLRGEPVYDHDDLLARLTGLAGEQMAIELLRGGQKQMVEVTVGERG